MTSQEDQPRPFQLSWHVRLLLGGYPPWWRLRYDEEMRETLMAMRAAGPRRSLGTWDLARGLLDAWLDPTHLPLEDSMPGNTRRLIPGTAWGLLLFVLAGSAFAKVIEDPLFSHAADQHSTLAFCIDTLIGAAVATAVVMSVATVVSMVPVLRRGSRQSWRALAPLLVVPVSVAAFAVTLLIARGAVNDSPGHRTTGQVIAFLSLVTVTVLGGACVTAALVRVATRLPSSRSVEVSRAIALVAVGVLTIGSVLSVSGWLIAAAAQNPGLLRTHDGLLSTPTLPTMIVILGCLLAAAALCGRSAVIALSSREAAPRSSH